MLRILCFISRAHRWQHHIYMVIREFKTSICLVFWIMLPVLCKSFSKSLVMCCNIFFWPELISASKLWGAKDMNVNSQNHKFFGTNFPRNKQKWKQFSRIGAKEKKVSSKVHRKCVAFGKTPLGILNETILVIWQIVKICHYHVDQAMWTFLKDIFLSKFVFCWCCCKNISSDLNFGFYSLKFHEKYIFFFFNCFF